MPDSALAETVTAVPSEVWRSGGKVLSLGDVGSTLMNSQLEASPLVAHRSLVRRSECANAREWRLA